MATDLQVRRVSLRGTDTPHIWNFPRGVTVIAGDSGGGKTSLLNLIKYGLGGNATITKAVAQAADSVTVEIALDGRGLQLTRRFSSNKSVVEVRDEEGPPIEYSTNRGNQRPWLSDLLLDALGIPSIRVPKSRNTKTHSLTSISFQDVFAYCYLDQEQIDRSTVFDNESPGRGPKRPWTFELLFGLIDARVAELEANREELAEETQDRKERLVTVERFIEVKELPSSVAGVRARLEEVSSEIKEVEGELLTEERALEGAVSEAGEHQEQLTAVAERLATALAEQRRIDVESREVTRAANQLERDLEAVREGEAAGEVLDPLAYEICPRCEQQLGERHVPSGHCLVCLQGETAGSPERESDATTITEQLRETRVLVEQLGDALAVAEEEVEKSREALDAERRTFAQARDQASVPFRRQIIELNDRLGTLRGEQRSLSAGLPLDQAMQGERQELSDAEPAIAELDEEAQRRREDLAGARQRVDDLSETFNEILRRFTLPWLETAEVDPHTYLPVVNREGLRDLSSGGMKTTTNVAYYLAVLVTALRDQSILLPSFLMLDSIRKASGAGQEDLARSDRMYGYLQTLEEMRSPPRPLPRDFQLIVVDNDMPKAFDNHFNTIRIDPQNPLIAV